MIYREYPYPLCIYLASGDTGSLVWGGGGGEYFVRVLCFYILLVADVFCVVLGLVVIVLLVVRIWVVLCF